MTALTAPTTPLTALAGVGPKTIEKIEAAGITNVEKLAGMTPEQLMEIPGIGEKMVDKIYQAVNRFYEGGEAPAGEAVENTDALAEEESASGETASAEAASAAASEAGVVEAPEAAPEGEQAPEVEQASNVEQADEEASSAKNENEEQVESAKDKNAAERPEEAKSLEACQTQIKFESMSWRANSRLRPRRLLTCWRGTASRKKRRTRVPFPRMLRRRCGNIFRE
jgi:N utilization substance protein A